MMCVAAGSFCLFVDWLVVVGWLVGWSVDQLVVWLVGWLAGWSARC